jgi:hypothetical protein
MSPAIKVLIGLAATLIAAWLWHGPLGNGPSFVDGLERQARAAVATTDLTGIEVRLQRSPLARKAMLSGRADDVQREGLGSEKGLSDLIRDVPGIARVRWTDEPDRGVGALPLLLETMILAALAYLIGLALGWLLWGRPRREGFA